MVQERKLCHARGPVAVLGDDYLGGALVSRVLVVNLVPVDEQDDVRVLFQASRLPEVSQDGTFVSSSLQVAGELREGLGLSLTPRPGGSRLTRAPT